MTMLEDIEYYKTLNVDRFVFGALNQEKEVDVGLCAKILTRAYPKSVTFHRAFDMCKNPFTAIMDIIDLGFDRLLTSGHGPRADSLAALQLLKQLLEDYGEQIQIMPGAGITFDNINIFIDIGFKIVHSTCKVMRWMPKDNLLLGTDDPNVLYLVDGNMVRKMKERILMV